MHFDSVIRKDRRHSLLSLQACPIKSGIRSLSDYSHNIGSHEDMGEVKPRTSEARDVHVPFRSAVVNMESEVKMNDDTSTVIGDERIGNEACNRAKCTKLKCYINPLMSLEREASKRPILLSFPEVKQTEPTTPSIEIMEVEIRTETSPTKVSIKGDAIAENDPGNLTRSISGEIVEQCRHSQGTTGGGFDELAKNGSNTQDLRFENSCEPSRANNEAELGLPRFLSEQSKIAGKEILRDEIFETSKVISEHHIGNPKLMLPAAGEGSSQRYDPVIISHGSM